MEDEIDVQDVKNGLTEYCKHVGEMCDTQGMLAVIKVLDLYIKNHGPLQKQGVKKDADH